MFFNREVCPGCGSSSSRSVFKHYITEARISNYMYDEYGCHMDLSILEDVPLEFHICNDCKMGFQKTVFRDKNLHIVYDEWMKNDQFLEKHKQVWTQKIDYNRRILMYAVRYLKKKPEDITFLDYGAGFGESLAVAKDMGFQRYALEYSQFRIEHLINSGVKVIDENDENTFDFIIVDQVLEHTTFPNDVLQTICKKMKPGALLYIAVPNCSGFENGLKRAEGISDRRRFYESLAATSIGPFQHLNFFTNTNLKSICKANGLERVFHYEAAFFPPMNVKSFFRPFYHYLFSTVFFLKKKIQY